MHPPVIRSGTYTITNPSQVFHLFGTTDLVMGGTSLATEPVIRFQDGTSNYIGEIDVGGSSQLDPNTHYYGEVDLLNSAPPYTDLIVQNGVHLWNGSLRIGTIDGQTVTLGGNSLVYNNSTFTAYGGRYRADQFTLNGTMTVGNNSVADFSQAKLAGNGTVNIGFSGEVDMKKLLAGINVNISGGRLHFIGVRSALSPPVYETGTIYETGGTSVVELDANVANLPAKEIFHKATGTMDLLNKHGSLVAELQFAPHSREYAQVERHDGGASVLITTTHQAHDLPTIFVH
jgi:hypothetical protein